MQPISMKYLQIVQKLNYNKLREYISMFFLHTKITNLTSFLSQYRERNDRRSLNDYLATLVTPRNNQRKQVQNLYSYMIVSSLFHLLFS